MSVKNIVSIGQQLTVSVKRLGINGEGIAYFQKLILFIPGALPKEKVVVEVTKVTPGYAEAALKKVLKKSAERQVPPCPIYEKCGGCQLQHLSYAGQLNFKVALLKQALQKFKPAGFENYRLLPTIGMDEPWHYRNKAQFPVREKNGRVIAGLFKANSHDLVSLTDCLVQEPITQAVVNFTRDLLEKFQVPIYDERKNAGIVKTLVVRCGVETGQVQLVFVTHSPKLPRAKEMIAQLTTKFPQLVSIMQNVQPTKTSIIFGEETKLLWGVPAITEKLAALTFDLSARAFFQLNPRQTKILYDEARKALALAPNETLVDAYCGVGTIGLSLAPLAREVRGMDIIPEAIKDARENASALHLTNAHYYVGTAETLIPQWVKDGFRPDAIVVDPPRTGLDAKLLKTLVQFPAQKLVYVSCNVSTLARDLKTLAQTYQVEYLQSVDMFPQTARCEVVVKLTRASF